MSIDIGLYSDNLLLTRDFDIFVQEIDILFSTTPTEILGLPFCGVDWDSYVWDLTLSPNRISSDIKALISVYTTMSQKFKYDVNCEILFGSNSDIILLTLDLWDEEDTLYKKTYKF